MSQQHKICTSCGYTGIAHFGLTKLSNVKCPKCKSTDMVSLRSEEGQLVLNEVVGHPKAWADAHELVAMR